MHLTFCTLFSLLFCFLFAQAPHFKDFQSTKQQRVLTIITLLGIIVGIVSIGIVGLVTGKPQVSVLCLIIGLVGAQMAGGVRGRDRLRKELDSSTSPRN